MKEYLYIFRGGDARAAQESPEAMQAHMEKWQKWMGNLGATGNMVGGSPLESEGKTINGSDQIVTDGPYTEGKEVVGGYVLIKAKDLNHATALSKDCPIFEYNGSVEVRGIVEM